MLGFAMLAGSIWTTPPARADNDPVYEATVLRPVVQGQSRIATSSNRVRQPLFDVTAVGVAFIGAFVGSILVFGWQNKWFAGAAAKASAGPIADQRAPAPRLMLVKA